MALSLSRMYIVPCVGKIWKGMVFSFLEHALNLGIFTHAPAPSALRPHPQVFIITN